MTDEEKCELLGIIQGKDKVIQELEKENAELKAKNCWKTCEYAEPKSQWISQHIQDIERYKTKWHDLRKNPKDLPKENQEVLVYFTLPDKAKNDVMMAQFENNDFNFVDLQDVIAWCKIPKFEEECELLNRAEQFLKENT